MMQRIFGNVVEADGVKKRIITIDNGSITNVEPLTDPKIAEDVLAVWGPENFGNDCLIFPGFIDIHTHCREDASGRDTHKEDYKTVGQAALSGGVVCVADMPNNPIVPYNANLYRQKRRIAEDRCPIDVLLYAAVNQDSEPFDGGMKPADIEKIRQVDTPYKAFIGPSTNHSGDLNFDSPIKLRRALSRYAGRSISFHCENPVMLGLMSKEATHELRRPPEAEFACIDTTCELIQELGLRGKICHVSTRIGLETVQTYKKQNVDVQCEVTPHHLYFDTEMLTDENRRWLQMNPPIRPRRDREALLQAVKDGLFDYLATDHAPHTKEEKLKGTSGVPMLDTYGPFVAWLLAQGVPVTTLFQMACQRPGEWVNRFWPDRRIGRIMPGFEASITVLDLSKRAIEGRPLYTKCGWSPFDLRELPGMVTAVWYKGEKVVDGQYMKGF